MAYWKIEFHLEAQKELAKLDKYTQRLLQNYLNEKILKLAHPKQLGKALRYDLKGYWRYRVDKFRIICEIQENKLIVFVLKLGKRDEIYDN